MATQTDYWRAGSKPTRQGEDELILIYSSGLEESGLQGDTGSHTHSHTDTWELNNITSVVHYVCH